MHKFTEFVCSFEKAENFDALIPICNAYYKTAISDRVITKINTVHIRETRHYIEVYANNKEVIEYFTEIEIVGSGYPFKSIDDVHEYLETTVHRRFDTFKRFLINNVHYDDFDTELKVLLKL